MVDAVQLCFYYLKPDFQVGRALFWYFRGANSNWSVRGDGPGRWFVISHACWRVYLDGWVDSSTATETELWEIHLFENFWALYINVLQPPQCPFQQRNAKHTNMLCDRVVGVAYVRTFSLPIISCRTAVAHRACFKRILKCTECGPSPSISSATIIGDVACRKRLTLNLRNVPGATAGSSICHKPQRTVTIWIVMLVHKYYF